MDWEREIHELRAKVQDLKHELDKSEEKIRKGLEDLRSVKIPFTKKIIRMMVDTNHE